MYTTRILISDIRLSQRHQGYRNVKNRFANAAPLKASKNSYQVKMTSMTQAFFSESNILTPTTCIADCVFFYFPIDEGLASKLACSYPELQQMRKCLFNRFTLGSLAAYFDQQSNRYFYNFVRKRQIFQHSTYEKLQLSLQVLKQHLKRHNILELAFPKTRMLTKCKTQKTSN